MKDVVFYEVFAEEKEAIRRFLPATIDAYFYSRTIQGQGHAAKPPAPLISIRTQSIIPQAWARQLKGIQTRSTGYDHLLRFRRRTKTATPLGYLPEYCSHAVAEQAIVMLMMLWRKMKPQMKAFDSFCRDHLSGQEARGKNLLVVGVGRIGRQVVNIARGLKLSVKGVDIIHRHRDVEYVSLGAGIKGADAVVAALPLTDKTKGILGVKAFARAKKGIVFVNVGRGECSPLKDMKRLLEKNILGGLGMDVFEEEGFLAEALRARKGLACGVCRLVRELKKKDNVIFTPHNAFNTREALEQKAQQSARAIEMFLKEKIFSNLVPSGKNKKAKG